MENQNNLPSLVHQTTNKELKLTSEEDQLDGCLVHMLRVVLFQYSVVIKKFQRIHLQCMDVLQKNVEIQLLL